MEQISLRFQHKLTTRTTLHEEGTAPDLKTTYPALFTKSGALLFMFGCEELRVGFRVWTFAFPRRLGGEGQTAQASAWSADDRRG